MRIFNIIFKIVQKKIDTFFLFLVKLLVYHVLSACLGLYGANNL